jgi:hypothetical protein
MIRVLGKVNFAYVDWDKSAFFFRESGSEPFLSIDAARLRSSEMVQFGPEISGSFPKRRDEEDERSS